MSTNEVAPVKVPRPLQKLSSLKVNEGLLLSSIYEYQVQRASTTFNENQRGSTSQGAGTLTEVKSSSSLLKFKLSPSFSSSLVN
jgi:hypothetical protein